MAWTSFWDMNSGGGQKELFDKVYIEAPEAEAKVIFYNKFGHNPERVSCTCCGADYSIDESDDFAQASGYARGCEYDNDKYVEKKCTRYSFSRDYMTVEEYMTLPNIKVIPASEIGDDDRKGEVPKQGYVWCD